MQISKEIIIICTKKSSRLQYIADFISHMFGVPLTLRITVKNINEHSDISLLNGQCVINYNKTPVNGAYNIYDSGFLFEKGIIPFIPEIKKEGQNILLFHTIGNFNLNFDLFSAIFYMISRYEEYLPFIPDKYGRFDAKQSLAYKYDFLEEPVVDQWLEMFKKSLTARWQFLDIQSSKFKYVSTIDIDYPWAIKHRSIVRNFSALTKDAVFFNLSGFIQKVRVLINMEKDPYDNYDYIKEIDHRYGMSSIFFILLGNYGYPDVNYAIYSKHFKNLTARLGKNNLVGIHPSYKSNFKVDYLEQELKLFKSFLGIRPVFSRQHFLFINIPETYERLISLGLQIDYSMGYASNIGFRCGTSFPYNFYNLNYECQTDLMIHPFSIMDVTLREYLKLNPSEAEFKVCRIMKKVKDVNGVFTSIWHNGSLSETGEWKGWRNVFEKMFEEAARI